MSRPSKIAIVKELGSRSPRCLAAHAVRGNDEPELVVVERYPAALGESTLATLEDDAKALAALDHPNVATLIWTVKLKGDVAVLSEWVDGESLETILASPQKPSLEVLLRIVLDALDGLAALHAFGDQSRVCGSLGPDDVFASADGTTRITRFALGRVAPDALGERRRDSMAPEVIERGERTVRADVFTAGALAWTCFMGERYTRGKPARVDASRRDAWAAPLADVIARALSPDPAARFATARDFSKAIADAVPSKIAARGAVSQYIARTFGAQIEARLAKLEPKSGSLSLTPPPTQPPPAVVIPKTEKLPEIAAAPPSPPEPVKAPEPVKPAEPVKAAEPAKKAPEPAKKKPEPTKSPEPAKVAPAARKPMRSSPETSPLARKVVPLPKRTASQPDSAPNVVAAAAKSAPRLVAKPAVAPKPAAPPAPTSQPAIEPAPAQAAPAPPAREDLDIDIELASMRPPPVAPPSSPEPPPEEEERLSLEEEPPPPPPPPPPAPPPSREINVKAKSVSPPKPKSVRPPRAAPAVDVAPAQDEDSVVYAKRSPYRTPLLVLGAIVLAGASFAAGRFTAPDPWPPTPAITSTPTATATAAPTDTSTQTPTVTPTPTVTATETATASASAAATPTHTSSARPSILMPTPPTPRASASGRYAPSGI